MRGSPRLYTLIIKGKTMLKLIVITALLTSCGTDESGSKEATPPKEITPPQPQQYEDRLECWTELICIGPSNSCDPWSWREVKVCQTVRVPVGI